jgi:hypothetical protein
MNHQPFEEWLLSDEILDDEQKAALNQHLQTCAECSRLSAAWRSVSAMMHMDVQVKPAEGFVTRWEAFRDEKKIQEQVKRQRRLAWLLLAVTAGGALLTYVGFNLEAFRHLPTIGEIFTRLLYNGVLLLGASRQLFNIAAFIDNSVPFPIPIILWVNLVAMLFILTAIWIISIVRLSNTRRSTKE